MSQTSEVEGHSAATARQRRNVNCFIVGAPKCGTTAWFEYLRSHPEIFIPALKEPCFFAHDFPNVSLVNNSDEYAALYDEGSSRQILCDASADYLYSRAAAAAIQNYNPEAKILIFLRNQADQLPSLHNHNRWLLWEDISDFDEAWRASGLRTSDQVPNLCPDPRFLDYVAMGNFREQVDRYLDIFPAKQMRVFQFADWTRNPRAAYLEILKFLNIDDDGRSIFPRVNEGVSYRSQRLVQLIANPPPEVRALAKAFKRITRMRSETMVKAASEAKDLLTRDGYQRKVSATVAQEICAAYASENERLERRLREAGVLALV